MTSEDWLNLGYLSPRTTDHSGLDASQSDFRFTYLGPRGTFTPLHRDVYASYSWSANIVGRKMWWLFPPDPEILGGLGIAPLGEKKSGTVFDVRCLQGDMEAIKILQNVSQGFLSLKYIKLIYVGRRSHFCSIRMVSSSGQSRLCKIISIYTEKF